MKVGGGTGRGPTKGSSGGRARTRSSLGRQRVVEIETREGRSKLIKDERQSCSKVDTLRLFKRKGSKSDWYLCVLVTQSHVLR